MSQNELHVVIPTQLRLAPDTDGLVSMGDAGQRAVTIAGNKPASGSWQGTQATHDRRGNNLHVDGRPLRGWLLLVSLCPADCQSADEGRTLAALAEAALLALLTD